MRMLLLSIGLTSLCACFDAGDPGVTSIQQGEIIEVHACQPGYLEIGDGDARVCVDPWHGDGDQHGGGPGRQPGSEPSTPGGGGGTPPAPTPKPRPPPIREDCSDYDLPADCKACCERNYWDIDVPECQKNPSSLCWETAILVYGHCDKSCEPKRKPCPRCITTTMEP